jgi:hypothetical protein
MYKSTYNILSVWFEFIMNRRSSKQTMTEIDINNVRNGESCLTG